MKVREQLKPMKAPLPTCVAQDTLEVPKLETEKVVVFWCQGCGIYHDAPVERWNGDVDNPTIEPSVGPVFFDFSHGEVKCFAYVVNGSVQWGNLSTHSMSGKSAFLVHEETWRPLAKVGEGWDKVPAK